MISSTVSRCPQLLSSQTQHGAERILAEPDVPSQQEIVENRHVEEQAKVLKGAGDPSVGDRIRREPDQALSLEMEVSLIRLVDTGDTIEQGGLAGTVRPIMAKISSSSTSRSTRQGLDSPEAHKELVDLQKSHNP